MLEYKTHRCPTLEFGIECPDFYCKQHLRVVRKSPEKNSIIYRTSRRRNFFWVQNLFQDYKYKCNKFESISYKEKMDHKFQIKAKA